MIYTVTLNPAWDERQFFDTKGRVVRTQTEAGGKGINVARILTALGVPCRAVTWVAGSSGEKLAARLEQEGIPSQLFHGKGDVRTNVKRIQLDAGDTTEDNAAGSRQSRTLSERILDWLIDVVQVGDVVTLNGSLAPGMSQSTYFVAISWLKRRGAVTILDASGPPLAYGAKAAPTLIKPNYDEFCAWRKMTFSSEPAFYRGVSQASRECGSDMLVTHGGNAAVWNYDGKLYTLDPPPVRVLQTCGAGDALLAGLVAGCHAGLDPYASLRVGMAIAGRFVSGEPIGQEHVSETSAHSVRLAAVPAARYA